MAKGTRDMRPNTSLNKGKKLTSTSYRINFNMWPDNMLQINQTVQGNEAWTSVWLEDPEPSTCLKLMVAVLFKNRDLIRADKDGKGSTTQR